MKRIFTVAIGLILLVVVPGSLVVTLPLLVLQRMRRRKQPNNVIQGPWIRERARA